MGMHQTKEVKHEIRLKLMRNILFSDVSRQKRWRQSEKSRLEKIPLNTNSLAKKLSLISLILLSVID